MRAWLRFKKNKKQGQWKTNVSWFHRYFKNMIKALCFTQADNNKDAVIGFVHKGIAKK